jgi:FMN phosphatase YigB (HAD superfamily)
MRCLAIDIGNVICHVNFDKLLTSLSRNINISKSDAMYFLDRAQKLYDLGLTTLKNELHDHFKIHSEPVIEELLSSWNSVIWSEPIMFEMLKDLLNQNVKVALLSNIGLEHTEYIDGMLKSEIGYTDAIHFFSCNVGARKPTLLYYQSFLAMHPEFKGSIYVDDVQDNLDASKKFGFKTVRFDLKDFVTGGADIDKHRLRQKANELKKLILK